MVKRLIPKPYEVARFLQQGVFNRGVQEFGIRLYHEPNYIPYRFHGPTVITVHDLSLVFYPETHPKDRVQAIGCKLEKAVHSADRIIVVSESVRREVLEVYGLPEDRVVTVHNGVDARFQPQPPERILEVRRRYGLPSGGYLVSVGTLEPRKNMARLISAYRALPKELRSRDPLVLVGMTGWGEDRFEAELWMLRREGSLIRTGYVADQDLPAIYAGATAFAYPSIYEGFGLPLVEAMACGTAVLTSNCSAMPEVVGNAGLLVYPFDVDSIRDGLFRLLRDEAERERCRMAGLARARRFSWARCARETADAYRSLL
jgi:glycosyltransferase involved in cell wall biosynthesis